MTTEQAKREPFKININMEVKEKQEKNLRECVLKINNIGKLVEADYTNLSSTQNNLNQHQ